MEYREKLKQLTYLEHRVFDELLKMSKRYKDIFISQGLLAKKAGMTRAYCNRALQKFKEIGLIEVTYRHRHSCIYKINPIIFTSDLRPMFMHFFKALSFLPMFLSLSLLSSSLYTPINSTVLLRINRTVPYIVRGALEMQNPIPEYVRNITCLNLSRGGQIKLSGMPQEAIEHAEKHIQYSKNIRDPFNWFFKMCIQYCKQEELAIDWTYVDQLRQKLNMPVDARMLLDTKIRRDLNLRRTGTNQAVGSVLEKVINNPSVRTGEHREFQMRRSEPSSQNNLEGCKFRKWTKQYETAEGEFKHALQHMIMGLDTIEHGLKYQYYCHDTTCRYAKGQ